MPSLSERAANVSLYAFEPAGLSAGTLQVVRFEGREGISQLYSFELHLVSERPDIDFSEVVNRPATFTMRRGDEDRPIHGLVTDFAQLGRSADYVSYRATLRPRLFRLSLNHRSRVFQEQSVEDILRTVLKEAGLSSTDFRFALQASYPSREFCVQYQESDLHFVERLMEQEGIYYFFDHGGGQEAVVVTDAKSRHERIPPPADLRYHDGAGGMVGQDQETVERVVVEEQAVPGTVQIRDYDARTPQTLTAEAEVDGERRGTHYEYGEHFRESKRGHRLANVRSEEIEARRCVVTGSSDCVGLRSGYLFTLKQHFRQDLNADYLVTEIQHEGSQRSGLNIDARPPSTNGRGAKQGAGEGGAEPEYRNQFVSIPATVQYRPPRTTKKPDVPGVVTATVESAGGDYAYIDDQGRYRARLHFDRRDIRSEGTKTLPIRMAQPYSGPEYGMHFPNHAGTEMLIAFENGDIDRPIALGTTPNPSNESPAVSDNKMENVLRTYGGNELLMDDTNTETRVRLRSAEAHQLLFDDNKSKIELLTTEDHKILLDDEEKRIEIRSKKGRKVLLDDENEGVSVVGGKGHSLHLSDEDETVTVSDTDGKHVLTLDYKNEKMSLVTEGDIGLKAKGAIEMKSESLSIETDENATMNIGGTLKQIADSNVTVEAKSNMDLTAGRKFTGEGGTSLELSAQTIAASGGAKVEISGTQLALEGSGMAEIKGGVLKLNG